MSEPTPISAEAKECAKLLYERLPHQFLLPYSRGEELIQSAITAATAAKDAENAELRTFMSECVKAADHFSCCDYAECVKSQTLLTKLRQLNLKSL